MRKIIKLKLDEFQKNKKIILFRKYVLSVSNFLLIGETNEKESGGQAYEAKGKNNH